MPKKTTVLILILALVTGVLVFLAVSEGRKQINPPDNSVIPSKKVVEKTARVFFSPANLDLSAGTASGAPTVDLFIDSGNTEISGVQVELQFDPKALSSVSLLPAADSAGFFGPTAVVLFNDVNQETGRVSFVIAIGAQQPAKKGVGKIASLVLQKAVGTTVASTKIDFLNKTLVTKLGENDSVLKSTTPLNITFGQNSVSPSAPFVPVTIVTPQAPAQ